MTITVGSGGINRTITAITAGSGGVNRTITNVKAGSGGVNRDVFTLSSGGVYLYNAGDECVSLTGGWNGSYDVWNGAGTTHYTMSQLTLDTSAISGSLSLATGLRAKYRSPNNAINFTNYQYLKIDWSWTTSVENSNVHILIVDTRDNRTHIVQASLYKSAGSNGSAIDTIDISGVNGSYYLVVGVRTASTTLSASASVIVNKIQLE
jgi:hypothetical protein